MSSSATTISMANGSRQPLYGREHARAFAPASVGNVAVGFDLLGLSVPVAGDIVHVQRIGERTVRIESVSGVVPVLPREAKTNTATAGLLRLIEDLDLEFGFQLQIEKGIPLGSGMGGSAASAVAAVVAANHVLGDILSVEQQLKYALIGESAASGSAHADNIAPSLLGGLTLARVESDGQREQQPRVRVIPLPIPDEIYCVLVHPHLEVETKQARGLLRSEISLPTHVAQSAHLAGFIAGCYRGDISLIRESLVDIVIEPQRAHWIPGFADVQAVALESGALGCSISGAGPSIFAWVHDASQGLAVAHAVRDRMIEAFRTSRGAGAGIEAQGWVVPLPGIGAHILKDSD